MSKRVNPPYWYWIFSIVAVLWSINVVLNLIVKECQWNNAVSGEYGGLVVAAVAGMTGSVLMLFKKSLAYKLFAISIAGMLIQQAFWTFKFGFKISFLYTTIIVVVDLLMIAWIQVISAKSLFWLINSAII